MNRTRISIYAYSPVTRGRHSRDRNYSVVRRTGFDQYDRRMHELRRAVRISLPLDGSDPRGLPRDNPFAAWPSTDDFSLFITIEVAVSGSPDPVTGYLVDITAIDREVRSLVIDRLAPAIGSGTPPPARVLRWIASTLPAALERHVAWVRIALHPFLSLTMHLSRPDCIILRQSFEFSASHRLHCREYDDATNLALFGKCNNLNGHGHNYRVEVAVETPLDTSAERLDRPILRLTQIESIVRREVIDRFDHRHLNSDTIEFATLNPSVEHIARTCHDLLVAPLAAAGGTLQEVTVWETAKTSCTYRAAPSR